MRTKEQMMRDREATANEEGIERFLRAQTHSYERALEEIRGGQKQSHWMWYIFPQMRGFGRSEMAWTYGIDGLSESREYLEDEVLGTRLVEISRALMEHASERSAAEIFGYPDDMKLKSSMTLFELVSDDPVFREVLDAFFEGERDEKTLELLEAS